MDIPKDNSVDIVVSSRLITGSEEIKAGAFEGSEVITVEWL